MISAFISDSLLYDVIDRESIANRCIIIYFCRNTRLYFYEKIVRTIIVITENKEAFNFRDFEVLNVPFAQSELDIHHNDFIEYIKEELKRVEEAGIQNELKM